MSTRQHHRHHHQHHGNAQGANDNAIQVLAHQIYEEKGGGALDNWLEAERQIKSSVLFVSPR